MKEDFLTAAEAARETGVSKELMARYCREGRLRNSFQKGKIWLIPSVSLREFQQVRKRYKPGRPRQKNLLPIFWRGKSIPNPQEAIKILFRRSPRLIPKLIPRSVANRFARHGRTKLEKIVRQSLVQGLYDPKPDYPMLSEFDMIFEKLHCIVDRIEPTDLYDLCLLHKTYSMEFRKVLRELSKSLEASELIVQIQRCLELTSGRGTKETLTKEERLWLESYIKKVIKDIALAIRQEI